MTSSRFIQLCIFANTSILGKYVFSKKLNGKKKKSQICGVLFVSTVAIYSLTSSHFVVYGHTHSDYNHFLMECFLFCLEVQALLEMHLFALGLNAV